MQSILIVEDSSRDMQQASTLLRKLGARKIQAMSSVAFAMKHLRDVVEDQREIPDLLLLDLEFDQESGFEVLRYWRSTSRLKAMRVIVWTVMGELEQRISGLFGVAAVVDKKLGIKELEKAVRATLVFEKAS